jgi:hypothetical protein
MSNRIPTAPPPPRPSESVPWPVDVLQLLDEHHLCAWSPSEDRCRQFGVDLAWHLSGLDDTQVCVLEGSRIIDLPTFCAALAASLGIERLERRIDTPGGVVGTLRRRLQPAARGSAPIKRRYYLWLDADVLLRRDPELFGRLVDAIEGVAAEDEYVRQETLLLQRAVFIGRPALNAYAEDPRGQFRRWLGEHDGTPGWGAITGVVAPRLLSYEIGKEVGV